MISVEDHERLLMIKGKGTMWPSAPVLATIVHILGAVVDMFKEVVVAYVCIESLPKTQGRGKIKIIQSTGKKHLNVHEAMASSVLKIKEVTL